ncbi:cupin domain-containing protein [Streptomyces violascens]|uniref:cupin domain-containing protein n=1 Tax=Streptomyces violascens TaxID=67381 RepID=UPI00167C2F1C|nr:cupin domain-containing protein [Streptomyces violascens]GGU47417.1 hypothetical protein GCM10010289_80020 [Streptomyces violascens]
MAENVGFKPNEATFDEGLERIQRVIAELSLDTRRIVTSRDPKVLQARKPLETKAVPSGFRKWQLPIHLDGPSLAFFTIAEPNAVAPEHSHEEGDGIRIITSGSINYNGQELSDGDWMFVPKGERYSFTVGPNGAHMFYCYRCCCAAAG